MGEGHDVLGFNMLTYVESVEESKAIMQKDDPMIIIAASGMADSGRIQHHLANGLWNAKNTVALVSFQAPNTLGRALNDGERKVEIRGESLEVRAEVVRVKGFSAHAGRDDLLEYALASKETLKEVFLVHGEEGPAADLKRALLSGDQKGELSAGT